MSFGNSDFPTQSRLPENLKKSEKHEVFVKFKRFA